MDKFVVKTPSASSKAKTRLHLDVNITALSLAVTANDRAMKYPPGTFHVDDGMLCRKKRKVEGSFSI